MKCLFLVLTLVSAAGLSAHAQSQIVKERAKGAANTPAPGNSTPGAGTTRPLPKATPANAQQQHIARLKADLADVRSSGNVTEQAKRQFARNLMAVAQGTPRPSTNSLTALANSLLPALADRKIPVSAHDRLVEKLVVVMNSRGLSAARANEITEEARTALANSGVAAEAAAQVATDLQTIATEVRKPAGL
ncbi:MAG: hypothetical protein H7Y43_01230 [Akkermansiaceae bacterium]|nr:hypothetical protein [Verrucomicrobiales bacterium]